MFSCWFVTLYRPPSSWLVNQSAISAPIPEVCPARLVWAYVKGAVQPNNLRNRVQSHINWPKYSVQMRTRPRIEKLPTMKSMLLLFPSFSGVDKDAECTVCGILRLYTVEALRHQKWRIPPPIFGWTELIMKIGQITATENALIVAPQNCKRPKRKWVREK